MCKCNKWFAKKALSIIHVHQSSDSWFYSIQLITVGEIWSSCYHSKSWRLKYNGCSRPNWMTYLCKMTPFATSVICNFFCWMVLVNATIIPTKETAADVWFSDDLSLLVMNVFLYYNLKKLLLLLLHKSLVAVQSIILNPFQSSCRIESCKIKCFAFNNTWQMVLDISSLIKASYIDLHFFSTDSPVITVSTQML